MLFVGTATSVILGELRFFLVEVALHSSDSASALREMKMHL